MQNNFAFTISNEDHESGHFLYQGALLRLMDRDFVTEIKSTFVSKNSGLALQHILSATFAQSSRSPNSESAKVSTITIWGEDRTLSQDKHNKLTTELRNDFRKIAPLNPVSQKAGKLWLNGVVVSDNYVPKTPPTPAEIDRERQAQEKIGSHFVHSLMVELLKLYPEDLADLFYFTRHGLPLPFFDITLRFGQPAFPLHIGCGGPNAEPLPKTRQDSYQQQRAHGAAQYNGKIYRLKSIQRDRWTIDRSNYFTILDDCDYLRSRMFMEWGQIRNKGRSHCVEFLRNSPLVKEWLQNIRAMRKGDFSTYQAGLAFTVPIFHVTREGTLTLLHSKGSPMKATGQGQFHCAPAGMLEFGDDEGISELDFETWKICALKELVEETMADASKIGSNWLGILEGGAPTSEAASNNRNITFEQYRFAVESCLSFYVKAGANPAAATALKAAKMGQNQMFVIMDAFRLRPEFVLPIFLTENEIAEDEFSLITNWENSGNYRRYFDSLEDAEDQLVGGYMNWAEPGLAAALLGAKHWFKSLGASKP